MSAIVLDSSQLLATIRDSLTTQMHAEIGVLLTERQARHIAANLAQAVLGLEIDETHIVDTIDTRTLLTQRERGEKGAA